MTAALADVTLFIVSDYEPGPKTWADEDDAVRHYAADPDLAPREIIVAASEKDRATPPPDWSGVGPDVRVIYVDSDQSATMKDAATAEASYDLVAVIEADCLSEPGWLAALAAEMARTPDLDAVSGLTMYEPTSALRRAASLLDRAFVLQTLTDGRFFHVSNNGALYRRQLLLNHPYPAAASPFVSAELRQNAMLAAGARFGVSRAARQYHAFGGWPFIRDVRRNKGHQHYQTTNAAYAPRIRRLLAVARGLRTDLWSLRKAFGAFCKPTDLPIAFLLILTGRIAEWRGATEAMRGAAIVQDTAYR